MRESLNPNMKAMDFVSGGKDFIDINGKSKHVIGYMRQFLFTGKQAMAPIKMFSGGEKNRLLFGMLMMQDINVLIMDEPTNHMDIEAIDALNNALKEFEGTLIFVSHDREFVSSLANRIIDIKDQQLIDFQGTLDEYFDNQQVLAKKTA